MFKNAFLFRSEQGHVTFSGSSARCLAELRELIERHGPWCVYHHVHTPLLDELYEGENDFAAWVRKDLGYPDVADQLAAVPALTGPTLDAMLAEFLAVLGQHADDEMGRAGGYS